jgi:hypothetical protein
VDALLFLIVAGLIAGYWTSGMRAREVALRAARSACARENVQLLDETVALSRLRLARDGSGRACYRRRYDFEFSDDGGTRRHGEVELLGTRPVALQLSLGDYNLHEIQ